MKLNNFQLQFSIRVFYALEKKKESVRIRLFKMENNAFLHFYPEKGERGKTVNRRPYNSLKEGQPQIT